MRGLLRMPVLLTAVAVAVFGSPALSSASAWAATHRPPPGPAGRAWRLPAAPKKAAGLPVLGAGASSRAMAEETAAVARARATGKAVVVSGLTSQTSTVTVEPDGVRVLRDNVLPVRVRRGRGWVPVDTRLRRAAGGALAPTAVPGDAVAFSGGGTGPLVTVSAAGANVALSWPGPLPTPVVSGSSATYRNVFPGVDLVLTATSTVSGGFSEVLVVRNAAAARDPQLSHVALRVSTSRTRLSAAAGGGMAAQLPAGAVFSMAPVQMWDSSRSPMGVRGPTRAAVVAARQAGSGLAAFGVGPVSTPVGPGAGARVAPVGEQLTRSGVLWLAPDMRLLASSSTRFPVYIDPTGVVKNSTEGEQAYDPVQSDSGTGYCSSTTGYCDTTNCTGSHYDSSGYKYSPVGYDNFQYGPCQFSDTDYSLYRVGVNTSIYGSTAHLISSSFSIKEVYTSSCSADPSVEVSWIGGIGSSTGWSGPGTTSKNVNVSKNFGPDTGSCNSTENTSSTVSTGFNITSDLKSMSANNITLRVWEPSDTNDANHKQLTDNPSLTVYWTDTPNKPGGLEQNGTNSSTGATNCSTSASSPVVLGQTDSVNGPYLLGEYSDDDGDGLQANIKYWNYSLYPTTSPASGDYTQVAVSLASDSSTTEQGWQMPGSFTSPLKDGTIVAWEAQAEDGTASYAGSSYGPYSSAWTSPCYFEVTSDPQLPPLQAANFDPGTAQAVGSQVSITISPAANATVSQYVWALDTSTPPTTSPPIGQTCTTSATTTPDCVIGSNGAATLNLSVPAPGPQFVSVYEQDTAGNDSGIQELSFTGAADAPVSFTGGSSLAANFAAALSAKASYDNTMISTQAGSSGGANADGGGASLDEQEMQTAGWDPGESVTVDGASFTLPAFGTSTSGPDNLLSANQTLGAGPSGAQGSALVILASSANANVQVGGLATGSSDSGSLQSDTTAPAVMGGTPTTGSFCSKAYASDTNLSDAVAPCVPASGTVNYASGCYVTSTSYTLTAPDWVSGPSDIAALVMPSRDRASGSQQADNPKIFAFAVPIQSSCSVASVTLPDVSASVDPTIVAGVTQSQPVLHILGVSIRNTTTATPVQPAVSSPTSTPCAAGCASPAGQGWTGAFASPVEDAFAPPSGTTWGDQTVRISASPNLSAPAGADVRIRLSDPGFLSEDGTGPLVIGAATIAPASSGPVPSQAPAALAFGGAASVTIPEGGDVYSDPLPLPFAVQAGQPLLVSLWIENSSLPVLPENSWPSGAQSWFAASSTPNQTGDATGTPFAAAQAAVPVLTGIDVTTPAETINGVANPGNPTVVVVGDNVIDGGSSSALPDAGAPSLRMAGQLASLGLASGYGAVDAGVQSNQVLADGSGAGGVSLIARIDRDVLAEPDVGTVVLDEGMQDLLTQAGSTTGETSLQDAIGALQQQLGTGFGINVITADITPCYGYANTTAAHTCTTGATSVEASRDALNSFITQGGGAPNCPADVNSAVAASDGTVNGYPTQVLQTADDSGDHANLPAAGYDAITNGLFNEPQYCVLSGNNSPQPPSTG